LAAAPAAQTVARFAGDATVRSSPSAADPGLAGWRGPGAQPAAAFDGDPDTAWISADIGGRRWLEVSWPTPHQIPMLRIVPSSITSLARPERVRVTTEAGKVTSHADATGGTVVVPPKAATRRVRIDLLGAPASAQVAIAEVVGLEVPERLVLPRETPVDATDDTVLLTRSPDRGSCVLAAEWLCSQRLARPGEDAATWRRELTVSTPGEPEVQATVRARAGPALDDALDAALGYATTGSSVAVDHPAARPGAALDGDYATAWISARDDPAPTLTVTYPHPVTVSQLGLSTDEESRGGLRSVVVAAGSRRQVVGLGGRRLPTFEPITAQTFRFTFVRSADRTDPLRVEELVLPGVNAPPAGARVRLPCGQGPSLEVGATRVDLAVDASAADLVSGASIPASVCGSGRAVLGRGRQQVVADATSVVAVQTVAIGASTGRGGEFRSAHVRRNDAEHRVVAVGAGPIALVVLAEGTDAGWRATANGDLLRPATVDRWQQAFVLPSGGPTVVDITFAPGRWHGTGLAVGGAALLVLLAVRLALWAGRSGGGDQTPPSEASRPNAATAGVLILAIGGVLGGGVGAGIGVAAVVVHRWRRVAVGIAATLYAVAGVAATRSSELSGGRTAAWTALGGLLLVIALALDAGGPAWRRRHRSTPPSEQGPFEEVPGETGD
jgi:arabinofuranan 3-O-arabinosyltransferase